MEPSREPLLPPWPPAPALLLPAPGEVLVLAFSLAPPIDRLESLRALLDGDERAKVERFVFPELRARAVASRGELRQILGAALALDPTALKFAYGANGKPSLSGPGSAARLRFNLSHSGDLALLALAHGAGGELGARGELSAGGELGVDVELHRDRSYDDIARRFFALGEQARLFALPPEQRRLAFFDIWTAKEAFVKATGDGITVPLDDFEARLRDEDDQGVRAGHIEVLRRGDGRAFWLRALPMGVGASGALVGTGPEPVVRLARWR